MIEQEKTFNKKLFLILLILVLIILIFPVEFGGQCFEWDSILFHFKDYRNGCFILPFAYSLTIPGYVIDIDIEYEDKIHIAFSDPRSWLIFHKNFSYFCCYEKSDD